CASASRMWASIQAGASGNIGRRLATRFSMTARSVALLPRTWRARVMKSIAACSCGDISARPPSEPFCCQLLHSGECVVRPFRAEPFFHQEFVELGKHPGLVVRLSGRQPSAEGRELLPSSGADVRERQSAEVSRFNLQRATAEDGATRLHGG